jgi:hypothetical protein
VEHLRPDSLHDLRNRLRLWGLICRRMGVGYSSMSSHEKARIGRGGVFDGVVIPDWLADIDHGVATCPKHHKLMLVEIYTKNGDWKDHIARLRQNHILIESVSAYYRRKNSAEVYLNSQLSIGNEGLHLRAS